MGKHSIKLLSGLSIAMLMQVAAAGTITNVTATNIDSNNKLVTISFSDGAELPQGFITDKPNRISLDFRNTKLGLSKNTLQLNDNVLSGITVAADKKRARVALNLNTQAVYHAEQKGNDILVYVSRAKGNAEPVNSKEASPKITVNTGPNKPVVTNRAGKVFDYNMDVKFTNAGENALIQLNLPEEHQPPKVERGSNTLIITFPGIGLANSSVKKYDVESFKTAVKQVDVNKLGNDTQVIVKLKAGWDYSVSDFGNQYAVTIKNQGEFFTDLDEKAKPKVFTGRRLTLDFENVDVRTILSILAKESGMNIIAAQGVAGTMTLHLKDVPWDQALDLVLESQDLQMRKNGNLINIAPRQVFDRMDQEIAEQDRRQRENGPLFTRTFQLKYKSVEDFKEMLNSVQNSSSSGSTGSNTNNTILSNRGSMMFDKGTNTLIVTDIAPVLDKFDKLVNQMDVPVRQVLIEAKIVEANVGFSRQLGISYGSAGGDGAGGAGGGGGGGGGGGSHWDVGTNSINLLAEGAAAANASLGYVAKIGSNLLSLKLNLMQEENYGKVVSSPRVLTQDRHQATIEDGSQIVMATFNNNDKTPAGTTTVDATTKLDVTPQITPDNNVIMDIKISKNSIGNVVIAGNPTVNVQEVQTKAMVGDGATLVLGGIYTESDVGSVGKIPFLGDIPLIGNLFKSRQRKIDRREVLIFITPRIMDVNNIKPLQY